MAKLILGPLIGGLTATQVNLWARSDSPAQLFAWLGQKTDLHDAVLWGQSPPLLAKNGFAGMVALDGLQPNTPYYYHLSTENQPPNASQTAYPNFRTFPANSTPQSFSFAFGSCFLPTGPNSGQIFEQLEHLSQKSAQNSANALRFLLMIGDQIYSDHFSCNGIGHGAYTTADYRDVYQYNWSFPALKKILAHIPVFMTLDDHEVDDDWYWKDHAHQHPAIPNWDRWIRKLKSRPQNECQLDKNQVTAALKAYWEHQGMHARDFVTPFLAENDPNYISPEQRGQFAYTFQYGAAAFFVMDTRTSRVKISRKERYMMAAEQKQALKDWLLAVKDQFPVKFVVTSCAILFQMWVDIPKDRWNGFKAERDALLAFLAEEQIEGVYFLTGDLHSAHAVSAELRSSTGATVPIWEFCSTPFEQKGNWLARATYWPVRSRYLQNQNLLFVCSENNFGVVRVQFREGLPPKIKFEIHRAGNRPPIEFDASI